ncbi:unnamed protein product [Cunninghamella echinulata]
MSSLFYTHSLNKEKKSKQPTQQYIYSDSEENGTIECICGNEEDNGFTIQCECCYTWQHGKCVHIKPDRVPMHYICYTCSKRNRLKKEAQHSIKEDSLRNSDHEQQILHSFTTTTATMANINEKRGLKNSYGNQSRDIFSNSSSHISTHIHHNKNQQTSPTFTNKHIIHHYENSINQNKDKTIQKSKSHPLYDHHHHHIIEKVGHDNASIVNVHSYSDDDDNDDDYDKLVKPFDYSITPSTSSSSISSSPSLSSSPLSSSTSSPLTTTSITPATSKKHKRHTRASSPNKFEKVNRNIIKHKIVKTIMQEAHDKWKLSNNNNNNNGKIVSLDATSLIPTIPKASARPLWKSLTGSYIKEDITIRKGLFADIHIPKDRFILEINGEIMVKSNYKSKPYSLYQTLHTPEDRIFFYPGLDLMMDTTYCGNDSRLIRRSCYPNASVKPIIVSHNSKDTTIHLGLFATELVQKSEELCIAWQWQRDSFIWKLYKDWKNGSGYSFTGQNLSKQQQQVDQLLTLLKQQFGDCACEDKSECFIDYLKKKYQKRIKSPSFSSTSTISTSSPTSIHPKPLTDTKQPQQSSRRRSSNSDVSDKNKLQQQRRRSHDAIQTNSTYTIKEKKHLDINNDNNINNNKRHKSHNDNSIHKPADDPIKVSNMTKNDLFYASLSFSKPSNIPTPSSKSVLSTSPTSPITHKKTEEAMVLDPPIKNEDEEDQIIKSIDTLPTEAKIEDVTMKDDDSPLEVTSEYKKWTPGANLPCKKAWIKSYLATLASKSSNPSTLSSKQVKEEFIKNFFSDEDEVNDNCNEEKKNNHHELLPYQNIKPYAALEQNHTNEMMEDLVLYDSMGEDSSTTTLCMDHEEELNDDIYSQKMHTSILPTPPPSKPAKTKLSLQQYLSIQKRK